MEKNLIKLIVRAFLLSVMIKILSFLSRISWSYPLLLCRCMYFLRLLQAKTPFDHPSVGIILIQVDYKEKNTALAETALMTEAL